MSTDGYMQILNLYPTVINKNILNCIKINLIVIPLLRVHRTNKASNMARGMEKYDRCMLCVENIQKQVQKLFRTIN